jgi:hypothetical protein
VLPEQIGAGSTQQSRQDERDEERVVELTGDRDGVRHEIKRHQQIADERARSRSFVLRGCARPRATAEQDRAVRYEPCGRYRLLTTPGPDQPQQERRAQRERRDRDDQEPAAPRRW